MIIPLRGCDWTCWVLLYSPLLCCFIRGRPWLCCRGRRVVGRSAPDAACGAGPFQDASAGMLLWSWLGPSPGRALECSCHFPVARYCFSRVPASTGCTVNCAIYWINVYQSPRAKAPARRRPATRRLVPRHAARRQPALSRCAGAGHAAASGAPPDALPAAAVPPALAARRPAVWLGASMIPGSATGCMIN